MPYLRVRYRHEVKCREADCNELIVSEGRTSYAIYTDGILVKIEPGQQDLRAGFLLRCSAGHEVDLYAPRDLYIIKSAAAGESDFRPIVLRTSLKQ